MTEPQSSPAPEDDGDYKRQLREYQRHLVLAEQKAQEDYDKTLVFLAGGSLAISFAFLDTITTGPPFASVVWLIVSWSLWALSLTTVLGSFWLSRLALRRALIVSLDETTSDVDNPAGSLGTVTQWANAVAGILFVGGLFFIGKFVILNIGATSGPTP